MFMAKACAANSIKPIVVSSKVCSIVTPRKTDIPIIIGTHHIQILIYFIP